jgi:hypothetical protein
MSVPDKGSGPQLTQTVLFNNGGTITAGTIYRVNTDGSVALVYFGDTGATPVLSVFYDMHLGAGKWAWPDFQ